VLDLEFYDDSTEAWKDGVGCTVDGLAIDQSPCGHLCGKCTAGPWLGSVAVVACGHRGR
jgi:hypothetical protein